MKFNKVLPALLLVAAATSVQAAPLINGGFEDGTTTGWTTGEGDRSGVMNSALHPVDVLPGGSLYDGPGDNSAIITAGTLDPIVGAALGTTVYSGRHSFRAEDTFSGGYASVISQKVLNYTDTNIFFAWKAVLEGAHDNEDAAAMIIELRDDTTGTLLISRIYNATAGGVDARFEEQGSYFYTPDWQIEQLAIDASLSGHDFTISLLAADCAQTGHLGYAYIDGFGAENPPPGDVPEPASAALLLLGAGSLAAVRRRKQGKAAA